MNDLGDSSSKLSESVRTRQVVGSSMIDLVANLKRNHRFIVTRRIAGEN